MDLLHFFGRFHVLALHLPIGIAIATLLFEFRKQSRQDTLNSLWALTALTAVLTALLGYMHYSEGGFTGRGVVLHAAFGTAVAVVATVIWFCRAYLRRISVNRGASIVVVLLVAVTGHYGGNLTHGSTYLTELAPRPVRMVFGLAAAPEKPTTLAAAMPYVDVVRPILERRCVMCHGDDRRRAQLDLSGYEGIKKGGESGLPAVVPGDIQASELIRRVSLPESDEAFMPADGKTPLTADEIAIIRWWISAGAPEAGNVRELAVEPAIEPLLVAELGLGPERPVEVSKTHGAAEPVSADPALVVRLQTAGFLVRQVSQEDPRLTVTVTPGSDVDTVRWSDLALAPNQVFELDLKRSSFGESTANVDIEQFQNLARLRLEHTRVDDGFVERLSGLQKLTYLNLVGDDAITDASVRAFVALSALQELYVWGTSMTSAGVEELRRLRPDLRVDFGAGSLSTR